MTNTISFPNTEEIEAAAAAWLAALDRGLSEEESQQLSQWIDDSPVHAETLIGLASVWDELDLLAPIANIMPIESQCISSEPSTPSRETAVQAGKVGAKSASVYAAWAVAASVLLLVTVQLVTNFYPADSSGSDYPVFNSTYQTQIGEHLSVALPDGSILKLNTDTHLTVSYTEQERRLVLHKGETYFDVAKNQGYPFKAVAGSSTVTAVGTAFNIQLDSKRQVEVMVTEGKVLLDKLENEDSEQFSPIKYASESVIQQNNRPILLGVGEKVVVDSSGDNATRLEDDIAIQSALAWHDGMIIFQGETLTDVIREVNRYTIIEFEITDEKISSIPIGGSFKTGDIDQLLLVLKQNFDIDYTREGNHVKLAAKAN